MFFYHASLAWLLCEPPSPVWQPGDYNTVHTVTYQPESETRTVLLSHCIGNMCTKHYHSTICFPKMSKMSSACLSGTVLVTFYYSQCFIQKKNVGSTN